MLKAKATVTEKGTSHWEAFRKSIDQLKGAYVSVGITENEYEDGTSVILVALWNEFGIENIPSRPFIRSVMDGKIELINKWRKEVLGKILDGKMTVEKGLETLGFRIRELIKNQINSNMPPPNADSTAARKRAKGVAPRTLVESTLLLRSVEYKVVLQ